jgi:hypothetical protein
MINPAFTGVQNVKQVHSQYSSFSGVKKVIRSFYTDGYSNIDSLKNHYVGFQIQNHSEGMFIQSNKLRLLYCYHLVNTKKYLLSAGTSIGAINMLIQNNGKTSTQGSAWGASVDFGLWYRNRNNWSLGISGNDILSNDLTPVLETYNSSPFWSFIIEKKYQIDNNYAITPSFVYYYNNVLLDWELFGKMSYLNYELNLSSKSNETWSWNAGISNIKIRKGYLKIGFGSNIPSKSPLSSNRYELIVSFYFK